MTDADVHAREVEAWRRARYAALLRDTSWLTLAGLHWLREGENTVGAAPDADVLLPAGPAEAGRIVVSADGVTATGAFRHAGRPADGLRLESDANGEPTLLELGTLRFCLIERGGRPAIRTWDLAADARRRFAGIEHWPIDPAWRLVARVEATPGRTIAVPDVLGFVEERESPADVAFEVAGVTHRLQGLVGGTKGELWLVFGDATNGVETYGGGRFLYTAAPEPDRTVVVDFNRAYNPPCLFSHFATCPLPWEANRMPIRVEAGERATVLEARE